MPPQSGPNQPSMISGQFTAEDLIASQQIHRAPAVRRIRMIAALILVAGVARLALARQPDGIVLLCAGAAALASEAYTALVLLPSRARKLHAQQADFREPVFYSWDDEAVEARGFGGQSRRLWANYVKVQEGPDTILLYHNDQLYEAIPKRWFADASQLEAFIKLARRI